MAAATVIKTENLCKVYGSQTAVDNITFEVTEGEIFGFLGPNGAGKTTTLLMLLGLTEPTSGTVEVLGMNPVKEPIEIKSRIGYLQENMGFYQDLNARQMLSFVAELNSIPLKESADRIDEALTTVGLAEEAGKKIGAYSRGMRQRLGLSELLIKDSKIAFLDEPTLGLDPDATNRIMDMIQGLCIEKKMTILLSSHMLHQVQKICHRIGIMIKGRMIAQGTMKELASEKLGLGQESYTLEEIYMKYFQEA